MGYVACSLAIFVVFTVVGGFFIMSQRFGDLAADCCKESCEFKSCLEGEDCVFEEE